VGITSKFKVSKQRVDLQVVQFQEAKAAKLLGAEAQQKSLL